jgi:acetyltransferase-like isoleucine patch superfamily enzyme
MKILRKIISFFVPYLNSYKLFIKTKQQASYWDYLRFRFGIQKRYWPAHKNCLVAHYQKIQVGINCLIGRPGNYIQGAGKVYFGNYVQLAPNVGILSTNHDLYDQKKYNNAEVNIGDYCWVGMNSVILPGVTLGTRTIVAAGSVVTKSFPQGFCVIGGSPAKVIKLLNPEKFIPWKDKVEFYGFIQKEEFEKTKFYKENYRKK